MNVTVVSPACGVREREDDGAEEGAGATGTGDGGDDAGGADDEPG